MAHPLFTLFNAEPKAVFLDLDNTLYDYEPAHNSGMEAIYNKLETRFPLKKEDIIEAFCQARSEIKATLDNTASSHSRLLYFQRMLELLGMQTQPLLCLDLEQSYWRAYLRQAKPFVGVKSFLYELRARNIKTVIVTDLTVQIQFRKLIHFGIDNLVDYVVTSEEVGVEKPSKQIFLMALEKVECIPQEVWMIGDSMEKDIEGAKACGIHCILTNSNVRKHDVLYMDSFNGFRLA